MAAGTPTITWDDRGPKRNQGTRGLAFGTGTITLSANSTFKTCGIEKFFRKCLDIRVQVESGYIVQWTRSGTHKAGQLTVYANSTLTGSTAAAKAFEQQPMAAGTVGTFVAFGL